MKALNAAVIMGMSVLAIFPSWCPAASTPTPPSPQAVCDNDQPRINATIQAGDYLQAIRSTFQFDDDLMALYAPPTFESGLLKVPARNLTIRSSFDAWKGRPFDSASLPTGFKEAGFETLLSLKGANDDDRLIILAIDFGRLSRRIAPRAPASPMESLDQQQTAATLTLAEKFGAIRGSDFEKFGDRTGLVVHLRTAATGPSRLVTAISVHGREYCFILSSSAATADDNINKLYQTMESASYHDDPASNAGVAAAQARIKDQTDLAQVLACVRELALGGQFGAASEELNQVRALIAQRMPGPTVQDNTGRFPLYGIVLRNPDPARWKLEVLNFQGMSMLSLEDRLSVNPAGIIIGTINALLTYGPHFTTNVIQSTNDNIKRGALAGGGRSGLRNMGNQIQSERFRMFKGLFAYEGTTDAAAIPDTKVKVICAANTDYVLMVIQLADARDYAAKSSEMETIFEKNLDIPLLKKAAP